MPDLITHISVNYLISKTLKKYIILTLFLFGAIYPDLFVGLQFLLIDILKIRPIEPVIACCVTAHSIFFLLLSAVALSLLFKHKTKAFISLFIGMLLHIFLDFFQRNFGGGNIILFPLNFRQYYYELFIYGVTFKFVYVIIPLIILFYIIKKENDTLIFDLKIKYIIASLLIYLILAATIIINIPNIIRGNIFFLDLKYHPEKFHNKQVEVCKQKIIKSNPPTVFFRGKSIILKGTSLKLKKNEYVYVRGIYNNKNKSIKVLEIYKFKKAYKLYISGIGILLLMLFIIFKVKLIFK